MAGIKETEELLIGINELAILLIKKVKDGIQMADLEEILSQLVADEEFKSKLEAAVDKAENVPAEMADLGFFETISLGRLQLGYVSKYIEALKK